jgi:hypothetical protein
MLYSSSIYWKPLVVLRSSPGEARSRGGLLGRAGFVRWSEGVDYYITEIQRSTRFDTGVKNMISTVDICANFGPHQEKGLAQYTATGPTYATTLGGGPQLIRDLAASHAAADVAMPNSGGTASSGLPAGKIRRLHLNLHPPSSPTLLRRAPALTVRSVCKGCRHFSFPIRRQRRRPEPPRALLSQGGSFGGRRRPSRFFPIRRQCWRQKPEAGPRAPAGEGGGPSRVGRARPALARRGRSVRREAHRESGAGMRS